MALRLPSLGTTATMRSNQRQKGRAENWVMMTLFMALTARLGRVAVVAEASSTRSP